METKQYIGLNERLHALVHVQNIEHEHSTRDNNPYMMVKITIPDDAILNLPWIRLDRDGDLKFAESPGKSHVPKAVMDENGHYIVLNKVEAGSDYVSPSRCELKTTEVDVRNLIIEKVTQLIQDQQFSEPVDISDVVSEITEYYRIFKAAIPLVEEAETARKKARDKIDAREKEERRIRDEEYRAGVEKRREEKRLKEEEAACATAKATARRLEWIRRNGSDILKAGIDRNYACIKKFLQEWKDTHLGEEWVLDYHWKIREEGRSCPTDQALRYLISLEGSKPDDIAITCKIVWLPNGLYPVVDEMYGDTEPCEAIRLTIPAGTFTGDEIYFYKLS